MDSYLIELADRIGDWLQTRRGVSLPAILSYTATAAGIADVGFVMTFALGLIGRGAMTSFWILVPIIILITVPVLLSYWRTVKAAVADDPRAGEEGVMLRYQSKALLERDSGSWSRPIDLLLILVWVWLLWISPDMTSVMGLLMIVLGVVHKYASTIMPRIPTSRRETKLAFAHNGVH